MKGMQPGPGFPGIGPAMPNMRPAGNAPGLPPNTMAPLLRPGGPQQTSFGAPPASYATPNSGVSDGPGSNINGFGGTPPPHGQNPPNFSNGGFHQGNRGPPPVSMMGPPSSKFSSSGLGVSSSGQAMPVPPAFSQPVGGQMVNGPSQMTMGFENIGPPPPRPSTTSQPGGVATSPPPTNTLHNVRPPGGMMPPSTGGQGPRPMMGAPPTSAGMTPRPSLSRPPLGPQTSSGMTSSTAGKPEIIGTWSGEYELDSKLVLLLHITYRTIT